MEPFIRISKRMTITASAPAPTRKPNFRRKFVIAGAVILASALLSIAATKQFARYTVELSTNTVTAIQLRTSLHEGKISADAAMQGFEAIYSTPAGGIAASLALMELNQAQDYDARSRLFLRLLSTVPQSDGEYMGAVYRELNAEHTIEQSLAPEEKAYAEKCLSSLMPRWAYVITEGVFGSRQPICAPRSEPGAAA